MGVFMEVAILWTIGTMAEMDSIEERMEANSVELVLCCTRWGTQPWLGIASERRHRRANGLSVVTQLPR